MSAPQFIVYSPKYIETSSGIRALHRLCHLLNLAGYRAAMKPKQKKDPVNPAWQTPVWSEPEVPESTVVIYPEIVVGNPLGAQRVVRWTLNYPGLLAGDAAYSPEVMTFVWDARMLERVSAAAGERLDASRVLTVPVIDPEFIYPDSTVEKNIDSFFIYKGRRVRESFTLPNEHEMVCIDENAKSLRELGQLLRRTRRLFSYDHATMIFHEALVSGCALVQVHADGTLNDPRECQARNRECALQETTTWPGDDLVRTYAAAWSDPEPIRRFAETVATRWPL
jgi:hypothetical protein